jgi:glucokinase
VDTPVHYNPVVLLAGDVGGTKTRLGVFERELPRPRRGAVHTYLTNQFTSFTAILDAFAHDLGAALIVDAVAVGVAGPVVGGVARLTNGAWEVDTAQIAAYAKTARVQLLNDLEAMALGAVVLNADETIALQRGVRRDDGNAVVIAAGTGLGQAYLHRINGRFTAMASEGGHADFAARTDREMAFVRMLRDLQGRAEVEDVLSGPGLLNLYRFTHQGRACDAAGGADRIEAPAKVTRAALEGTCAACAEALSMFVEAYGAEAGNLGLRGVATSGVFVGGGIAPKILPALQQDGFIAAFRAKGAMSELAARIPVNVILSEEAGLLGAAVAAEALCT